MNGECGLFPPYWAKIKTRGSSGGDELVGTTAISLGGGAGVENGAGLHCQVMKKTEKVVISLAGCEGREPRVLASVPARL